MIRAFQIDVGFDMEICVAIDTDVVTQELADSVACFWSSKDEVAAVSVDTYEATARYAGVALLGYLLEGYNQAGACNVLHEDEGWCWPGEFGITILDYCLPNMAAAEVECKEIEGLP